MFRTTILQDTSTRMHQEQTTFTHFRPFFSFKTRKNHKSYGFLGLLHGIEKEHWTEMG